MNGAPCSKSGCKGVIEDGYCNECGIADRKASTAQIARTAVSAASAVSGTSPSRGRTNTGSAPGSRAGARGSRRTSRSSSRSTRSQLGAGLIQLPDLPSTDPEKQLMLEAKVPENKRFCSNCDNALARERGFCGKCGRKFSFVPSLQRGDIVAGQYEVRGPMAYGGLGWIYLGFDQTLTRYVVLKGLLNTEDEAAAAAAVAERKFLATVKHPNIVGIYNFVKHGGEGFIVMEYINGRSLKQIRKERGPLPPAEAIAYMHRILGSFGYLHGLGLVYCDFKPDNVMVEGNDVKLIDMGGVRRIDDPGGDIYGTTGYTAPEAGEGPTVVSDLYTVARTLAVLVTDIPSFSRDHRYSLPDAPADAVFSKQESLYRALLKATAENPDDRFQTADEMADQLLGVLREVVAIETKVPRPAASNLFGADMLSLSGEGAIVPVKAHYEQLPIPTIDQRDPAMRALLNASAMPEGARRVSALEAVRQSTPNSLETLFRLAAALTDIRNFGGAIKLLDEAAEKDAWDWRIAWYRGRALLAEGRAAEAQTQFEQVYFDLPGEIPPKLGLALAAELAQAWPVAIRMYDLVARTDPSYMAAIFGLSRSLAATGDRKGAVLALGLVPESSGMYLRSRVESARVLINDGVAPPGLPELTQAGGVVEKLLLDELDRFQLSRHVLSTALRLISAGKVPLGNTAAQMTKIMGYPADERGLRLGLEKCLREIAHLTRDGGEKIRLVDEANSVRPRSLM